MVLGVLARGRTGEYMTNLSDLLLQYLSFGIVPAICIFLYFWRDIGVKKVICSVAVLLNTPCTRYRNINGRFCNC